MRHLTLAMLVTTLVASTAAEAKLLDGGTNYVPPTTSLEVDNAKTFPVSYDKTWKAVVAHLSETSFVIDNIDKDSGLITVSFAMDDAQKAIDCGQWTSWVKNMRGRRDYSFDGAAPYAKYESLDKSTLMTLERNLSLSGKFNILVTEPTEESSRIKVTTRYVPTVKLKVTPLAFDSNFQRVQPRTFTESFSFNTGQEAQLPGAQTVCRSKGFLEAQILEGISGYLDVPSPPQIDSAAVQ